MKQLLTILVCMMFAVTWGESPSASKHATAKEPGASLALTPDEAQQRLKQGNARFVAGKTQHPHESSVWRLQQEEGQHPFATILGCSDSRVPPEVVFDVGLGDLFVVRVAGNVYDGDVAGSIEYAVEHLATPLVLVMGHTGCGAVMAAVEVSDHAVDEPREIIALLQKIQPSVPNSDPKTDKETRLAAAVEANVRRSMRQLADTPSLHKAIQARRVRITGAIYDLHTGEVRLLEATQADVAARDKRAAAGRSRGANTLVGRKLTLSGKQS